MALDTRDKRASAIHVGQPWRGMLPLADAAAEDQGDRQQLAGYYRGILATAVVAPGEFGDLTTLFVAYVQDLRDASALALLDNDTLVALDVPTVRAAQPNELDDANTMYAAYLS
jgi:hypothetical protein